MIKNTLLSAVAAFSAMSITAADARLSGTPIGTERCWNYETNRMELNTAYRLFDGDLSTYYATEARSYTWAGLDLQTPHVITRVGWSPRNDRLGPRRVLLGVFQGANSPDFLDAVPIFIITDEGVIGQMSYGDVECSRGFRYVRYVSTSDARCNMAELEFYGHEGIGDDSHLFQITNLPTVVVNTVGSEEPYDKEHDITANIIIIDGNGIDTDKSGSIRERGNGSRAFPKKPWRLKFDKKQSVLDAPAKAKKWTLINNYGDKTLMRNMVGFEIARRMDMEYVPFCRPVDVILNGEFKGCYQLCDQVEVNPGRMDITEMAPDDIEGEALTGGYFIEVDAYANLETSWFTTDRSIPVTIKSPKDDEIVPEQTAFIRQYFQQLEDMLFDAAAPSDYRSLLDVDSFLRHFIVNELVGNTDTYWSTYFYKERGVDMFHVGPVWDMDLGFDNDNRTFPIGGTSFLFNLENTSAATGMRDFARRIIYADPLTLGEASLIWSVARNTRDLTPESLKEFVDETAEMLDASQKLNFIRWPILGQIVHQNPRAAATYRGEVQYLKSYITKRFNQLDAPGLLSLDPSAGIDDTPLAGHVTAPFTVSCGRISVTGGSEFSVWSPSGTCVFAGAGTTGELPAGIYIVRTGGFAAKVAVR